MWEFPLRDSTGRWGLRRRIVLDGPECRSTVRAAASYGRPTLHSSAFAVQVPCSIANAEVILSGPRFKLAMALGSLNGAIDLYNIFLAVLFCVVDGGDTDPVGEKGTFF